MEVKRKALFNKDGDIDLNKRRIINGNTTNLNDFNNMKYKFASKWYRQAMNNFWVPEEINLQQDIKDYKRLTKEEKTAYDKILSFLVFLDSIQTANLPNICEVITANEINLCLTIQSFQEALHSQSYSYMLDTICSPEERDNILYQWKNDDILLKRNEYVGNIYNEFINDRSKYNFVKTLMANYVLEGIYFYSGFMFFYNLARFGKMPGSSQEIRYINRDENTHLWLFRNIILELQKEEKELFTDKLITEYKEMIKQGCLEEIKWAKYVIGNNIQGLSIDLVSDYIKYLGNLRSNSLNFGYIFDGYTEEPKDMSWVSTFSNANDIKTDFFEARSTAYAKASAIVDDL